MPSSKAGVSAFSAYARAPNMLPPVYTASAPALTAARRLSIEPAGARSSGHLFAEEFIDLLFQLRNSFLHFIDALFQRILLGLLLLQT